MNKLHLLLLAQIYAAHIKRSLNRVAVRAGAHSRLFQTIQQGGGCHVDTLQRTFDWFAANWPADLEWPASVPRPAKAKDRAA